MKKLFLSLTIFLFVFTMLNAQDFTVLLVDDDVNGASETSFIENALTNASFNWQKAVTASPSFADMENYDMVLWYTGNDGVDLNLWKTDDNGNSVFNDALVQFAQNDGIVWVDGLDFFKDIVDLAPKAFTSGSFIYDKLGITDYLSQSKSDDGGGGVQQYDVIANSLTTTDPIEWSVGNLWYADGLAIAATAIPMYKMYDDVGYSLHGQITALYNQSSEGTYITSGFRLGRLTSQAVADQLVGDIVNYVKNNWDTEITSVSPLGVQTISVNTNGTDLTVSETVGWDSREWKWTTISGSNYASFGPTETAKTYTPNFTSENTYYVICETTYGTAVKTSNEVQINVISNSIAPINVQHLAIAEIGTQLNVTETPAADSRDWMYSTTLGGPYSSFTPTETGTSYTPSFDTQGIYYVVCESVISGTTLTSNEVKIVVDTDISDYYLNFDGNDAFYIGDNANDDLDVTTHWTYEAWVKVEEYNDGDYSRIMYRDNRFSLHLINDADDDFAISFKSYMGTAPSLSSENSATSNLEENEWFHVAVTRDGTDTKLFINGEKVAESPDLDFVFTGSINTLNIGAKYVGSYSNYLKGSIENLQISEIARYTVDFTVPSFYAQQNADVNSVLCLNLENNGGTDLFDASGHFTNVTLLSADNDAEWKLKTENSVSPTNAQNILESANGIELIVSENGIASNTEWKFSTTSGGGHDSFTVPESNKTYTPNFASAGTYYVVCQSVFNGTYTSNEVIINVTAPTSISTSAISGSPFYVTASAGTSVDVPYTITGTYDVANTFTAYLSDDSGDFATETAIGSLSTETEGTINATIPANTISGSNYRIRVKSNNPAIVGTDNGSDLTITLRQNPIAPTSTQHLVTVENGTVLNVTETPAGTSREWKFATTSGGAYSSFTPAKTETSYTPSFDTQGIYYVVCESIISGTTHTSNEVKVVVDTTSSNYYLEYDGDDNFYVQDVGENYINVTDNWTIETWVKVDSRADATFPVIIDREACFSMYVQGDGAGTDDYSIAFVSRNSAGGIVSSLSSANQGTVEYKFNKWYHVAVQYNGTDAKMFINGNEVITSTDNFTLRDAGSYINIGARHRTSYERFLTGSIENIHFSNVARYAANFTPDFYAQQNSDANSIFCLNFENNGETDLFDASGNFTNLTLRSSNNDAAWKLKAENSISPNAVQNIVKNTDGTELTVYENGIASSNEWKFSTTSGSDFTSFTATETNKTYTPNFSTVGTYYVVCESIFNGTTFRSNEVEINVGATASVTTGTITSSPYYVSADSTANISIPYTITGTFNAGNVFTAYLSDETGSFATETAIGTYTSTTNGTIDAIIPVGTISGIAYRVRVKSNNPILTGSDNGVDFEIKNVSNSITPVADQSLSVGQDGNVLTASETPVADSREWKYSTTSGSNYLSFSTSETGTSYTPSFSQTGTYYVVCQSSFNSGDIITTSNEVIINIETEYKILFVNDDDNVDESNPIDVALSNSAYTYYKVNTTDSVPSYEYIQNFNMIIWYTGNDGVTNLWDADSTYINQLELFVENGGTLWVDGLDFIYDIYGGASDDFVTGEFIYDKLGISQYLSQTWQDDGNVGVPQMDILSQNKITSLNPLKWQYSSLQFADGLSITDQAIPLYAFGDENYVLAGQVNSLYRQENFGTYLTTGLRIAKLGDGTSFVQDNVNTIVSEVIAYSQENVAVYCGNIAELTYYITATEGTTIKIPYSIDGGFDFNSNNIFTAYLSDETGSFVSETAIGTLNFTASDTIFATIPAGTTNGNAYRVRVKASNPSLVSNDNGVNISILSASSNVTPSDEQTIYVNQDGTELTVNETPVADSREWKYTTTSGSNYLSFSTSETGMSYTPNFNMVGTYYVICESTIGTSPIVSNEIVIHVLDMEIATGTINGSPFGVTNATGVSVNVPYTITGVYDGANVFTAYLSDATGDFTSETVIGSLVSAVAGTITSEIPANTTSGTAYRIRVKSNNPVIIGADNGVDIKVDLTVGINNIKNNKINIYPNPASDILYIERISDNSEVKIIDNLGRIIYNKKLTNNSVNISEFPLGIYTIIIKTNNLVKYSKFIKK